MNTKVFVAPDFIGDDKGDGGIRRVVEAQKKYLPEFGIDVITTPAGADVAAFHAGYYTPVDCPIVTHCHGLYWAEYDWANWALQLNRDVISNLRRADVVTVPSEWVGYALKRGMWLNPVVLPHGIDLDNWNPEPSEGYVLWNKTRIDPVCEVDSLHRLATMAPDVNFRSTFGFNGMKNLTITGIVGYGEAAAEIKKAGVYLCTTRETFGIGTLEAMACGVPILGWNWGGQAEIVEHRETGYLARPGNYDDLLAGLRYCLEHRTMLGSNARDVVTEKYTWCNAISRYAALYNQLALRDSNPKVSVVIPLYNLGQYLEECLKSVINQTLKDVEIIVVDDHSTDDSFDVANRLAREVEGVCRIRVIQTPRNLYLSGALNYGINEAKGKYIIPLDADNYLGDQYTLETLASALDKDRDLDIAYGAMRTINPDGSVYPLPGAPDGISPWPPTDFSFLFQMMHRNQCPSTSMYRKEVWSRSGGYRRRCRTAEDADFWCRVTSLGFQPHKVTDAVTLVYRVRADSMSTVQSDWPWQDWYPWSRDDSLTPMGVRRSNYAEIKVPSYEPPLVSVVIPVGPGHTEKVIDAVDSVVAQTFQKWEVIVVNDSGEDIPWIHPFVKVLSTPEKASGPAVARNLGIAASKASTFLLLDADDILQPDALQRMYEVWIQNPNSYVYGDWVEQETGEIHRAPEYDCSDLLQSLPHAVTALYPRSCWDASGGIDVGFEGWEDWDFILSINERGYCGIHLPLITFQYRVRGGNRREELYARRDELKQNIYNKWRKYIEGEVKLAGCGGCGGSFVPVQQAAQNLPQANGFGAPANSEMVLIEFVEQGFGDMTYRGYVTGTTYRFGSDPEHRVGYVYRQDLDHFLAQPDFRLFAGRPAYEEPLLVAPGPPQ